MVEIYVETNRLKQFVESQSDINTRLCRAESNMRECISQLDYSLHSERYPEIRNYLGSICDGLLEEAHKVNQLASTLNNVVEIYHRTEQKMLEEEVKQEQIKQVEQKTLSEIKDDRSVINSICEILQIENSYRGITDVLDLFSKIAKEVAETSKYGLLGPVAEYIQGQMDFWLNEKKGLIGWENFWDSNKKGANLWEALYDRYYAIYGDKLGFANFSKCVGIFSSISGFLKEYTETAQTESVNWQELAGMYMGVMGGIPDISKELYQLWGGKVPKNGGWFTFATMGISVISQGVESYGKYSADGKFSFMDGVNTTMDASVSGLTEILEGITGGIVDLDDESLSELLKDKAKDIGTDLGNTILNDPVLRDKAVNGNVIDKAYAYIIGWEELWKKC